MFVLDGAKARIVALVMTAVTAVPLFPHANAETQTPKAAPPQVVEAKVVKKTKKKKADEHHATKHYEKSKNASRSIAWGPKPILSSATKIVDPLKLVLATARKQLGKPYHYGSAGPSSFDCSGFTMYVWRSAGVYLPHSSSGQFGSLPSVPLSKARPGDLVYSPGHIGLYIGDGKMIHAPQTGQNVEIAPLHSNVVGAVRPKA
jgi:peptidoglycan DL-endopeptidase CwlO